VTNDDGELPDELCPRQLLEEWTVPEMPKDMKERVMAKIYDPTREQWNVGAPAHAFGAPPQRSATAVVAITTAAAALVASAAAVVMTVWSQFEPTRPEAAPAAPIVVAAEPTRIPRGHLTIAVTPVDAEVELDGISLPGPSPFVATGLAVGPHELRVHREGHIDWTRVVQVPASQLHLPIALSPAPKAELQTAEFPVKKDIVAPSADEIAAVVRQASAIVKGTMDKDIIRRIVRAHINEIRYCYNQGLAKDPALEGRVSIQFTIGPDGKVAVAVVQESTLSDAEVGQCMAKAVKRWTFPKPDGGGNVVVTYPFVLEPG
jgi:TonB family protein